MAIAQDAAALDGEAKVLVQVGGMQNMAWAADTSKFGYKMLVKMGWSAGKGVGKDLQGAASHVKIARRSENLGVGCSLKQAEVQGWSNTSQSFADVLNKLNKAYGNSSNSNSSNSSDDSDEDEEEDEQIVDKKKSKKEKKWKKSKKDKKDKKKKSKKSKKKDKKATDDEKSKPILLRRIVYNRRLKNKNAKAYDATEMSAILGHAASSSSSSRSSSPTPIV